MPWLCGGCNRSLPYPPCKIPASRPVLDAVPPKVKYAYRFLCFKCLKKLVKGYERRAERDAELTPNNCWVPGKDGRFEAVSCEEHGELDGDSETTEA